jgi:hypothetical protein
MLRETLNKNISFPSILFPITRTLFIFLILTVINFVFAPTLITDTGESLNFLEATFMVFAMYFPISLAIFIPLFLIGIGLCLRKKGKKAGEFIMTIAEILFGFFLVFFYTAYLGGYFNMLWSSGMFFQTELIFLTILIFLGIGIYLLEKKRKSGIGLDFLVACIVVIFILLLSSLYSFNLYNSMIAQYPY